MTVKARLLMKAGVDCWDRLTLIIKDRDVDYLHALRDRYTCIELYRQLAIYHFDGIEGEVLVDINGQRYRWRDEVWKSVLGVIDQWYTEYMLLVELEKSNQ